jgi:hypothetical protein
MDRTTLFYIVFGAAVVAVPAILDRLLEGRFTVGWRIVIGLFAAALLGLILALIGRLLGV